jgi:hypothetical protein
MSVRTRIALATLAVIPAVNVLVAAQGLWVIGASAVMGAGAVGARGSASESARIAST